MAKRKGKSIKGGATPLSLPTKKSVPMAHLDDYIQLYYGREKIGKTSLAAQFPDAVFLMFEPGGRALEIYQVDVHSWIDFKNYIKLLKEDSKFRTIVIDTIDLCYRMCLEYVQKHKLGGNHPADEGYGKGWDKLKAEFSQTISDICKLGKGVIMLSHETEREIKLWKGGSYDLIAPTMSGVARDIIEPMVDIFGYYYYGDDEQRYIKIEGDSESVGGTRLKEAGFFKGIDRIPMGNSAKEGYKNLCDAFSNKLKVTPQTKVDTPKRKTKRKKSIRKGKK